MLPIVWVIWNNIFLKPHDSDRKIRASQEYRILVHGLEKVTLTRMIACRHWSLASPWLALTLSIGRAGWHCVAPASCPRVTPALSTARLTIMMSARGQIQLGKQADSQLEAHKVKVLWYRRQKAAAAKVYSAQRARRMFRPIADQIQVDTSGFK